MSSGHVRRISELSEDHGSSSSSSVGNHKSLDNTTTISITAAMGKDHERQSKRRKTSGLNSRFDRMVQTMSATLRSPAKRSRHRTRSTGSSSVSSHDIPRTPVDAYIGLQCGRLGTSFSVIKMDASLRTGHSRTSEMEIEDDDVSYGGKSKMSPPNHHSAPLPPWLYNTFSTLAPKHPLRLLLPPEPLAETPQIAAMTTAQNATGDPPEETPIFAFSVPDRNDEAQQDTAHEGFFVEEPDSVGFQSKAYSSLSFAPVPNARNEQISQEMQNDTSCFGVLPFTTPGPGSLVSHPAVSFVPPMHHTEHTDDLILPLDIDSAVQYSSDDAPNFDHSYEDITTDDSASDPVPEAAYIQPLPDLFSTPGPGYRAPFPIYFDSPTEEPSDSDPLEPGYKLDYDTLDFRWRPFIQKNTDNQQLQSFDLFGISRSPKQTSRIDSLNHRCTDRSYTSPGGFTGQFTNGGLDITYPVSPPLLKRTLSSDVFRFAPPLDDNEETYLNDVYDLQKEECPVTPTKPELEPSQPVFAPAPGIFISPLRDSPESPLAHVDTRKSPGLLEKLDDINENPSHSCSQISNDSIESWRDTDTMY